MLFDSPQNHADPLVSQNRRLRRALSALICWAGESPDGPSWATPEAKKRNRAMFEAALTAAYECFPLVYDSRDDEQPSLLSVN